MSIARDKVIGSTIHNTAEMRRMETGKLRISTADVVPVVRVALVVPEDSVVRVALAVPEDPVVQVALVAPENPVAQVALAVPEDPVAQVALVVPENPGVRVALVAPENPGVPAALELELARAVAELERGPEAEEPVPNQPRARLAVPLRIKSVTGPRRHGQVLLRTVEDLAAVVAVITLEPVAAEAVTAWEAVATAAVVAVVATA